MAQICFLDTEVGRMSSRTDNLALILFSINATGYLLVRGELEEVRDRLMRTSPPGKTDLTLWCI